MKFSKIGEYLYGADATEVEEGSEWAINPQGFGHGWIAWGDKAHGNDGTMLGETMIAAAQPILEMPGEVEGTWTEQRAVQLACISGEDEGTQCLFKTSSIGGKKFYAALVLEVVKRIEAGESAVVPVITLDADSYTHASYGKIFTPMFTVIRWEELGATESAAEEAEAEPEPEKPTRRKRKRAA
jgi:hypothetical protein